MAMIIRESVSDACLDMLRAVLKDSPFMQVIKVSIPVWMDGNFTEKHVKNVKEL